MPADNPHIDVGLDVKQIPVSGLVSAHTAIVAELMARKLSRTRTAPTSDLPALLVAGAYQGERAGRDDAWDITAGDQRLVVRGRMQLPSDRSASTYAPIHGDDFDAAVFVAIDATACTVLSAIEVPAAALPPANTANGARRVRVDLDLGSLAGARDVTTEIEKALAMLDVERFARRQGDDGSDAGDEERPTGWCLCGCGQRTDPDARFLVMHDRRADSPALRERYGTIAGLIV